MASAALRIFEPPRFFEAFLRGRGYAETPDLVARICGICPVAYQMSAVHAIENAFGAKVDGQLRALRRLIYCGEWIESHALHVVMLHAPDFLGFPDAIKMARDHGDAVRNGLALKKAGNELIRVIGGGEIHPVNVKAGGFHRVPTAAELRAGRGKYQARVRLVTGDTKVVERGKGDGLYVNTSGIGLVMATQRIAPHRVQPGDAVILSGDIARHGIAVMAVREGLGFETTITSDCAPLAAPIRELLQSGIDVHCLRDLTRGGLATALIEIAEVGKVAIRLDDSAIPVSDPSGARARYWDSIRFMLPMRGGSSLWCPGKRPVGRRLFCSVTTGVQR